MRTQIKISIVLTIMLSLTACDYLGSYTFIVKNDTGELVELRFKYESTYYSTDEEFGQYVTIYPGKEEVVRII